MSETGTMAEEITKLAKACALDLMIQVLGVLEALARANADQRVSANDYKIVRAALVEELRGLSNRDKSTP